MRTHTHPQYTSEMRTHTHPQDTSEMRTHTHPQYTSEVRTYAHIYNMNKNSTIEEERYRRGPVKKSLLTLTVDSLM